MRGTSEQRHGAARFLLGPLLLGATVVALGATSAAARTTVQPGDATDPGGAADEELLEVGRFLYGRDCVSCHGVDGDGTWRGPSLALAGTAGTHYMVATGRMPLVPPENPVRRPEPEYTPEQVAAIVAHVATLVDGPTIPDLDTGDADLSTGGRLYRLHCAHCHSSTLIGGALLYGEVAPALYDVEPLVVASAVVSGPGAMPRFDAVLTEDELASVVAYVEETQTPVDQGGFNLARAGRVDEGLVGWGVGLGGLVLAAAWIGRGVRP